jgi:hypothetical protein
VTSLAEGALKERYIKNFMVLQMRHKKCQKSMLSSREFEHSNQAFTDYLPMNQHEIYGKLGVVKGDIFMSILKPNPCSLSGSTHAEAVEYHVPVNWHRMTKADLNKLKLEVDREATDDDKLMMDDFAQLGVAAPASSSDGSVAVKTGPNTELDVADENQKLVAARIESIREAPEISLRRYQDLKIDITKIKNKAENRKDSKYAKLVHGDAVRCIEALDGINDTLEKMVSKAPPDAGVLKLLDAIEIFDVMNTDLQDWANKLGFVTVDSKSRSKRRKKVKTEDE